MTDAEWRGIAAVLTATWPSSRWPEETQAIYRTKLDGIPVSDLARAIDKLVETSEFLPSIAAILGQYRKAQPTRIGSNGAGCVYGTREWFDSVYGEKGEEEHRAYLEWRATPAAQLENQRSGANGPRAIGEAL